MPHSPNAEPPTRFFLKTSFCSFASNIRINFSPLSNSSRKKRLVPLVSESASFFAPKMMTPKNGGFRKKWYPQIIHFNRVFHVFHYKPSILGENPYVWKHPNGGRHLEEDIANGKLLLTTVAQQVVFFFRSTNAMTWCLVVHAIGFHAYKF